jgi:hypothetical protein
MMRIRPEFCRTKKARARYLIGTPQIEGSSEVSVFQLSPDSTQNLKSCWDRLHSLNINVLCSLRYLSRCGRQGGQRCGRRRHDSGECCRVFHIRVSGGSYSRMADIMTRSPSKSLGQFQGMARRGKWMLLDQRQSWVWQVDAYEVPTKGLLNISVSGSLRRKERIFLSGVVHLCQGKRNLHRAHLLAA